MNETRLILEHANDGEVRLPWLWAGWRSRHRFATKKCTSGVWKPTCARGLELVLRVRIPAFAESIDEEEKFVPVDGDDSRACCNSDRMFGCVLTSIIWTKTFICECASR